MTAIPEERDKGVREQVDRAKALELARDHAVHYEKIRANNPSLLGASNYDKTVDLLVRALIAAEAENEKLREALAGIADGGCEERFAIAAPLRDEDPDCGVCDQCVARAALGASER